MSTESRTELGIASRIAAPRAFLPAIALGLALLACGCPLGTSVEADPVPTATPGPDDATRTPEPEPSAPPVPHDPPRVLTDPGSGVTVVWAGAAAEAVVAGPDLIVLEPGGAHLGAQRWSDGEARWRIEVSASEAARLHTLDDRVVLHDGDRATLIEAARGRTLSRTSAPVDESPALAHALWRRRDACAWVGPCGIQALDCTDGSPRGDYLRSTLAEPTPEPGAAPSCRITPALLGRHEQTLVLLAEASASAAETSSPVPPALLGLDAVRGSPRWTLPLPAQTSAFGMTDDGGCWYFDPRGPRLHVHACDDGSPRWDRPIGSGTIEVYAAADGLIVAREQGGRWRLSTYATADGGLSWSTRLGRRQRPVLPDEPIADAEQTGNRRVYALIDPLQGDVLGELVAGRDERLWRDPGGGFVLIGRELRELDANGHLTRQRPFPATEVQTVTAGHVLGQQGEAIEIYDRDQLRERARIEGRMHIETDAGLPGDRLLLRRHGDDGVALVLGLEAPTRGGPRR